MLHLRPGGPFLLRVASTIALLSIPTALASPTESAQATMVSETPTSVVRWGGPDRITTAIEVSRHVFPTAAAKVYLARSDVLVDSMVAGSLRDGPILLTPSTALPAAVSSEIARLGDPHIVVVGGPDVVSDQTAYAASRGEPFERLGGRDRFETAAAVSAYGFDTADIAYVADGYGPNGQGSPDAASGGTLTLGPILLAHPTGGLPLSTQKEIARLGSPPIVQLGDDRLPFTPSRYLGSYDRYATSVSIALEAFTARPTSVYLARGDIFADSVTAGSVTDGPILLVRTDHVPPSVCVYLRNQSPTRIVAIGSAGAVSEATLQAAASCATRAPYTNASGYTIHRLQYRPYEAPVTSLIRSEPYLEKPVVDKDGVIMSWFEGRYVANPVDIAQWGLKNVSLYNIEMAKGAAADQSQAAEYLRLARNNALRLRQIGSGTPGGAWLPYQFDYALAGDSRNVLRAPWYSAMAQGEALSLFTRLFEIEGDTQWRAAMDATFTTLTTTKGTDQPWATFTDRSGHLWLEEYAGNTEPLSVINGHIFSLLGAYEYFLATQDARAERLVDQASTTIRETFPDFRREGGAPFYCVQNPRCQAPVWANPWYHNIVIDQLRLLAGITADPVFEDLAMTLDADH